MNSNQSSKIQFDIPNYVIKNQSTIVRSCILEFSHSESNTFKNSNLILILKTLRVALAEGVSTSFNHLILNLNLWELPQKTTYTEEHVIIGSQMEKRVINGWGFTMAGLLSINGKKSKKQTESKDKREMNFSSDTYSTGCCYGNRGVQKEFENHRFEELSNKDICKKESDPFGNNILEIKNIIKRVITKISNGLLSKELARRGQLKHNARYGSRWKLSTTLTMDRVGNSAQRFPMGRVVGVA
ncbi:hypothetical protein [Leptospira noguchii]|uniref:Uncharacterized protein n=1 Tax=Leptospira noguchii TaxID=28182 RepID=A0AAE9GK00_9LEPT|nr:hypothetical protein [Leptospira noguchii]UOG58809.1 hypothetical protein MAL03_20460 [Leptospira noguchii]